MMIIKVWVLFAVGLCKAKGTEVCSFSVTVTSVTWGATGLLVLVDDFVWVKGIEKFGIFFRGFESIELLTTPATMI